MRVVLTCCMHAVFSVLYEIVFFCLKKLKANGYCLMWASSWYFLAVSGICYCGICVMLWYIFSACGARYGIVKFCAIFFCVWNALWCCVISCYIFLHVEHALVLWNFVLYFSACQWNVLWYCRISCYIFSACGTRSVIVEFFRPYLPQWMTLPPKNPTSY